MDGGDEDEIICLDDENEKASEKCAIKTKCVDGIKKFKTTDQEAKELLVNYSWNSYFFQHIRSSGESDANLNLDSVVYAIFSMDELIYIGKSCTFQARIFQHMRELANAFILKFVPPKVAAMLRPLALELRNTDTNFSQKPSPSAASEATDCSFTIKNKDSQLLTSSEHFTFVPVKEGLCFLESSVLESELIYRFRHHLTNLKIEKLYSSEALSETIRREYISSAYQRTLDKFRRRKEDSSAVYPQNFWAELEKDRLQLQSEHRTEIVALTKRLRENGLLPADGSASQCEKGETLEFAQKIYAFLREAFINAQKTQQNFASTFLHQFVKGVQEEVQKMARLKRPLSSSLPQNSHQISSRYTLNPLFPIFEEVLSDESRPKKAGEIKNVIPHLVNEEEIIEIDCDEKVQEEKRLENTDDDIFCGDEKMEEGKEASANFGSHSTVHALERGILRRGGQISTTLNVDVLTHILLEPKKLGEKEVDDLNIASIAHSEKQKEMRRRDSSSNFFVSNPLKLVDKNWLRRVIETRNKYLTGVFLI